MRAGAPAGGSLQPDRLEHILEILRNSDLLERLGVGGDFEDVGEGIVLRVIVDDLDPALLELVQRRQTSHIGHSPLLFTGRTNVRRVSQVLPCRPGSSRMICSPSSRPAPPLPISPTAVRMPADDVPPPAVVQAAEPSFAI